jgi:hypothetical protein
MKTSMHCTALVAVLAMALTPNLRAADSAERAAATKEKMQALRVESAKIRNQKEVQAINNPDIRKEAEKRYAKRKKSYDKIQKAMLEARDELVPFMSDLNDIVKLLDSELTEKTVAATRTTIRSADWHGADVRDSLSDVEKELDRVAADLAKYQ